MTILERYNAVKNKTLRDKLLRNYDAKYVADYWKSGRVDSDRAALKYGFLWRNSPEGDTYWRTLADAMAKNETTFDATFVEVYPAKTSVMEQAGFTIPEMKAHKDDPRGKEYGFFVADTIDGWEGKRYLVTKWEGKKAVWSATFTEDSFLAWASDNT
jgi:hypothetical protein